LQHEETSSQVIIERLSGIGSEGKKARS